MRYDQSQELREQKKKKKSREFCSKEFCSTYGGWRSLELESAEWQ